MALNDPNEGFLGNQNALFALYGLQSQIYILEVQKSGVFQRAIALPFVNSISFNRQNATDFSWTLGNEPIIDHSGIKSGTISIQGRSGFESRLGQDSKGNAEYASGPIVFRSFVDFINDYQEEVTKEDNKRSKFGGSSLRMSFLASFEEQRFNCEIESFSWQRSTQSSRFSYEYSMTIKLYGRGAETIGPPGYFAGKFNKVFEFRRNSSKFINTASSVLTAIGGMQRLGVTGTTDLISGWGRDVANVVKEVPQVMAGFGAASQQARRISVIGLDICDNFMASFVKSINQIPYGTRFREGQRMYEGAAWIGEARRDLMGVGWLEEHIKQKTGGSVTKIEGSGGWPASQPSFTEYDDAKSTPYTVGVGEDLTSIAAKFLGSTENALLLAKFNQMASLWEKGDGSPLKEGDTISIPAEGEGINNKLSNGMTDPYGKDFMLDPEGDFILEGGSATDFALIQGPPLIEQALSVRLRTEQGQHGVYPSYGLPRTIGDRNVIETAGVLLSRTRTQLLADPRIQSASRLTIRDEGDTFFIECILTAVGGQSVNAKVPIGA